MDGIKEFLYKEAQVRVNPQEDVKSFLFKEAAVRTDYKEDVFDVKEFLFDDAVNHLASVDKEGMASHSTGGQYAAATNLEVWDYPYEEHPRVNSIKNAINEKFAPLLIQRIKEGKKNIKINLAELFEESETTPFYIRLSYKKHILPVENKKEVESDLQTLAPGLAELVEKFDQAGLAPLQYYPTTQCDKDYPDRLQEWALSMNSSLMSSGQNDFTSQNPALRRYWQQMSQKMQQGEVPSVYKSIGKSQYGSAARVPLEEVSSVKRLSSLLSAIHFAETGDKKTLYQPDPIMAQKKKSEWEAFVLNQVTADEEVKQEGGENKDADLARRAANNKAKVIADKVWKVFGITPQYKRDIKGKDPITGKNRVYRDIVSAPYDQFTQQELRLLLKFLKVPWIRWTATPKERANGLDMEHIYPPMEFTGDKDAGRYTLDFKRPNMGLQFIKTNLQQLVGIDSIVQQNQSEIDSVYNYLIQNQAEHPIMSAHTGADNLLFFLQQLPNMETAGTYQGITDQIYAKHGKDAKSVINLASLLLETKANQKDDDVLNNISNLYTYLSQASSGGVSPAYKLAKVLDVVYYTILKNLPDPIYGVRGRNYTAGGETGEILVGVDYAYSADLEDVAGYDQSNVDVLKNLPTDPTGANLDQIRKTRHFEQMPKGEFPTMPGAKPPTVEGMHAKISPDLSYIVSQKTGERHRRRRENLRFSTLEAALADMQSKYPQAEEFMDKKIHLVGVRMNSAIERIKQSVLRAIEIVQNQTGIQFTMDTGEQIGEAAQQVEQQVQQLDQEIKAEMPDYAGQGQEQPQKTYPEIPVPMVDELVAGSEHANQIVGKLLFNEKTQAVLILKHSGIQGQQIVDLLDSFNMEKSKTGENASIAEFGDWIVSNGNNLKSFLGKNKTEAPQEQVPGTNWTKSPPWHQQPPVPPPAPPAPPTAQASVISRLVKLADRFDKEGHINLVNKIDLLITKLS